MRDLLWIRKDNRDNGKRDRATADAIRKIEDENTHRSSLEDHPGNFDGYRGNRLFDDIDLYLLMAREDW